MDQRRGKECPMKGNGDKATLYARLGIQAWASTTAATSAIATTMERRRTAFRVAALFAVTAGLFLLAVEPAHAQINPDAGADQVFEVIGLIALIAGLVMAIGSLFARRIMAALGFGLGGGLIWAFCANPEGTIGGAAEWLIQQFQGGGG